MGLFDFLFGAGNCLDSADFPGLSEDSDITADYVGRHGEFDRNDEERGICEDMLSARLCDDVSDEDLTEQFGWENKLNYDSEGYAAEECDY